LTDRPAARLVEYGVLVVTLDDLGPSGVTTSTARDSVPPPALLRYADRLLLLLATPDPGTSAGAPLL